MKKATATEVKNRFGEYLDIARKEPVFIQKSGRNVVVMISQEEYDAMQLADDRYWGELSQAAIKEGNFLGPEASMAFLQNRLAEIDALEAKDD